MNTKYFSYISLLILLVVSFGFSSTAYSQCMVTDGGDDGSANQLRDCIENSGEAIVNVDPSVTTITLAGEIIFDSTITVNGNNATVDGDVMGRIFSTVNEAGMGPFDIELNDLTLTGGTGVGTTDSGDGGAIYNAGHNFTINRCTIEVNNAGNFGGGIHSQTGMVGGGSLEINQSTIDNNTAAVAGGGLSISANSAEIDDSTISNNNASGNGGGIILLAGSSATITNSTIANNMSTGSGGGVRTVTGATLNLVHVTVADNLADTDGASITSGGGLSNSGTENTTNILILRNTSGGSLNNCDDAVDVDTGGNSVEDDNTVPTCGFTDASPIIDVSLILADNGGPTLTKNVLTSSNIATASAANCEAMDQRGFDRAATNCTPGAVEALDIGTISIMKATDPMGGTGFAFTSTNFPDGCDLTSPFTLDDGDTNSCIVPTDATDYTVTETVPAGFELTIDCAEDGSGTSTDDGMNPTVEIGIAADGDTVDCIFTNADIDACVNNMCDADATCADMPPPAPDTPAGRTCTCNTGFVGNGEPGMCADVDACIANACDANATCADLAAPAPNTPAGRTCTCDAGFVGNGEPGMCADVDACINNPCDANATCADMAAPAPDTPAGRTCTCDPPFTGDGEPGNCADAIDACINNPCDTNAICTDLAAQPDDETGRSCECQDGFEGDGEPGNCTNIDDCSPNPCENGGTCTDGVDSFTCVCPAGFEGDTCDIEIPECVGNDCDQLCLGADGSGFICGCFGGFILDDNGTDCNPADTNIVIGNEETDEDGLTVLVEVGNDITGRGTILIDVPPQVRPEFANLSPDVGDCSLVFDDDSDSDPDSIGNVLFEDADIICEVENLPSTFDLQIGLCADGDQSGLVNAEIEVIADGAPGGDFDELVQIVLNALDECDGGGGCSIASSNVNSSNAFGNLLVMLLPAIVGIGGIVFRRKLVVKR